MGTVLADHYLRESDLIRNAAVAANIKLQKKPHKRYSSLQFNSSNVGVFSISKVFIEALKKEGFTFGPGRSSYRRGMVYLSGNSNQRGNEIHESDCWAWEIAKGKPRLSVYFRVGVEEKRRGVVCAPQVWGNCSGGACHQPTINAVVRVIARHFPNAHTLIKEAGDTDTCQAIVPWDNIGVGGVKSVGLLFEGFFGKKKQIVQLAQSTLSPFNPKPFVDSPSLREAVDNLFVLESAQPFLVEQWEKQLRDFVSELE